MTDTITTSFSIERKRKKPTECVKYNEICWNFQFPFSTENVVKKDEAKAKEKRERVERESRKSDNN